jgi:hypothetical protein
LEGKLEHLLTREIPFDQIENGALILYLLRECKTWEELCGRFKYALSRDKHSKTQPPDLENNTTVYSIHRKLTELRSLGLLSFDEQTVDGKKPLMGRKPSRL